MPKNQGEGDYEAARRYNEHTRADVQSNAAAGHSLEVDRRESGGAHLLR